jgi:alkylation response protein AidB-like acyl-CoA dehydrogenase
MPLTAPVPRPAHESPRLTDLLRVHAPLLADVAAGALRRELDDVLPFGPVRRLKEAGFGALRLAEAYGGPGLTVADLAQVWVLLAAADPNLPQVLRGHYALVEDRLWQHARGVDQRGWFERFAAGEIAGNAWAEPPGAAPGVPRTLLTPRGPGEFLLDGTKCYATGCVFAEWADVQARLVRPDGTEERVVALVDTRSEGVVVVDDWDGFGQRGTGSGTTTFHRVVVPAVQVQPLAGRFPYQTAFYQLNLLATLAGIGRAALADAVAQVRGRDRHFSHGNAARPRDDVQVLARIGEIAAAVHAAEAATLRAAAAVQRAADAPLLDEATVLGLVEEAEIETSTAQVVVTDLVLRATSDLFDTLGASATSRGKALDRHWRNARTVSSHNPRILKARVVGDFLVNGTPPPYDWTVGTTSRDVRSGGARPGDRVGVTGAA